MLNTNLFSELSAEQAEAQKGGLFLSTSVTHDTSRDYSKSFNDYNYSGEYKVVALNESYVGTDNAISFFSN